jgi:hypothetical protein
VIGFVECIQRRRRGVARAAMGGGVLRAMMGSLILCEIKSTKGVSGSTRLLGRERGREEESGYLVCTEFIETHLQVRWSSMSDLCSLEARLRQKKREAREGVLGYLRRGLAC